MTARKETAQVTSINTEVELSLFHGKYDVFIGPDMKDLYRVAAKKYKMEDIKDFPIVPGYTCLVHGPEGTALMVFICTGEIQGRPSVDRTIWHEAVHVAWYILESTCVQIDTDNHEIQAYLVEEIIEKITESKNSLAYS